MGNTKLIYVEGIAARMFDAEEVKRLTVATRCVLGFDNGLTMIALHSTSTFAGAIDGLASLFKSATIVRADLDWSDVWLIEVKDGKAVWVTSLISRVDGPRSKKP